MQAAEQIATSMMDYLKIRDKRQTNAWVARTILGACEDPALRAKWLNNLGNIFSELGDRGGAREATQEALDIRRKLAEKHPEAFLPDVAMTLNNLGEDLSELGDTEGAIECFRELMDVGREVADLTGNHGRAVQARMGLASSWSASVRQSGALCPGAHGTGRCPGRNGAKR